MSWVLTILGFVALILLHELGHFAAAKAVGMRVERFSLFFGPLLVKFRRGETEYGVGPIPLGGYVKISGMNPKEELPPEVLSRSYFRQPVWKRVVVIAAGPAVNLVLAFVILWVLFVSQGIVVKHHGQPVTTNRVAMIDPGQPASGVLRVGDRILGADGRRVSQDQLPAIIAGHRCAGTPVAGCPASSAVTLIVQRAGRIQAVSITPRYRTDVQGTRTGFAFDVLQRRDGAGAAVGDSLDQIGQVVSTTTSRISQVFFSSKARKQVNSVVGGAAYVNQAIGYDAATAFSLLALISLSLAIINLFPFLPLDGGHIFWALAEKLRGRAIPFAIMERASVLGFALVLMLFAIGLSNDVHTLSNGGFRLR